MLVPGFILGAADISGMVIDAETGNPLPGVNVVIQGTDRGAATTEDGRFMINGVNLNGQYTIAARMMGYGVSKKTVNIPTTGNIGVNFGLAPTVLRGEAVAVVADRARDRETPVAFSNVDKPEIEYRLGSRDIPLLLNTEPGVYATEQGGGPGDSRINVRGFDQRNVAVMINGVPVNDMENGWVYWSNWDGLGDVTSSIQIQRGLGASGLAISSVGGTLNIITDPAAMNPGGKVKQEVGSGNFIKTSFIYNTGLFENGLAASIALVRKRQDGIINKTWSDAYAYYGAMSYSVNRNNKIDLYIIGAPQRHGQRVYQENIATFDAGYAAKLSGFVGADQGADYGLNYNPNWGRYNHDYQEYDALWTANASVHDRPSYKNGFLMERENYYHKPQVNFNWYSRLNEQLNFTNVAYYSQGIGGGTGGYYGGASPATTQDGLLDFNDIYQINSTTIDSAYSTSGTRSQYVMRNSVNQHHWFGDIFTARYMVTDRIKLTAGIDWRYYKGEHYREIRNLLGGDYFVYTGNANDNPTDYMKGLGDKIAYHNDGLVRWLGGFSQVEGSFNRLTAFGSLSYSMTGYKRVDYFLPRVNGAWNSTRWAQYPGYTVKAGANYNLSDALNVYVNLGHLSKAPIFDAVYNFDNTKYAQTFNEQVTMAEIGAGYSTRTVGAKLNIYNTLWRDRSWPTSSRFFDADSNLVTYYYLLQGIDARHSGVELDLKVHPTQKLDLELMTSLGDWGWLNNVNATFSPEDYPEQKATASVYTKGLKVGGSAQKTVALSGTFRPVHGATVTLLYKYFMDHYANFDPADRNNPNDTTQPWKIPDYGLLDLHAYYTLPFNFYGTTVRVIAHGFNLLDTKHITDATDNDYYNSTDLDHDADDAGVFFGLPRRFNLSLDVNF